MLSSNVCTYRARVFRHFAVFDSIVQRKTLQAFELLEYVPMSMEVDMKCLVLESTRLEDRKNTAAEMMMMLMNLSSRERKKEEKNCGFPMGLAFFNFYFGPLNFNCDQKVRFQPPKVTQVILNTFLLIHHGQAPKTPKLSIKARGNPLGYPKSSSTEYAIIRSLRSLGSHLNFSEPGPSTLTYSPPSTRSIRASSPEIERSILYYPFSILSNLTISFTLLFT
jgi:hypothetical protein